MKIIYPNLNVLNVRCDAKDKEQRSFISIVVPSKTKWLGKKRKNKMKVIREISLAY